MAIRDRRMFQVSPVPPSSHPPVLHHIPFYGIQQQHQQFQHQQHQHIQQQQQHQQQHQQQQQQHQQQQRLAYPPQFYHQRPDAVPHTPPSPFISPADLAMASAYRQRAGVQPQPVIPAPPPPSWDDRVFRATQAPRVDSTADLSRLDNSARVMLDGRFTDTRLHTGYRSQELLPPPSTPHYRAGSHERTVQWQPAMYNGDVIRSYSQRSPPNRVRDQYTENGVNGRYTPRCARIVTATPSSRVHNEREVVRKRSRERSPGYRSQRQRIPEHARQGTQRRYSHYGYVSEERPRKDDDEREDGQVTPSRSLDICEDKRKVSYSTSFRRDEPFTMHRRERPKRDRVSQREQESPTFKKPRHDERVSSHADLSVGPRKLTPTGLRRLGKDLCKERNVVRIETVMENVAPAGALVDKEGTKADSIIPAPLAEEKQADEQIEEGQIVCATDVETVDLRRSDDELLNVTEDDRHKELEKPAEDEALQEESPTVDPVTAEMDVISDAEAKCEKPAELEQALLTEPDKLPEKPVVQEVAKDTEPGSNVSGLKPAKQSAMLTIKKNPSIPVAFKARTLVQTGTSNTWHRPGNPSSGAKPSAGNAAASYVRKGNSLVRTTTGTTLVYQSSPSSSAHAKKTISNTLKRTEAAVPLASAKTSAQKNVFMVVQANNGEAGSKANAEKGKQADITNLRLNSKSNLEGASCANASLECGSGNPDRRASDQTGEKSGKTQPVIKSKLSKALRCKKQSLVWTLGGSNKTPSLLPWKKRLFGKARPRRLPKGSKGSLLSLISKKLQAGRASEPLYTRSPNGFSLHRSGVRSVDGASLKWTKSLQMRSREANEVTLQFAPLVGEMSDDQEATKAVAAVEKQCRTNNENKRKLSRSGKSRERIVLVGLVRYKMDPSKRSLERLPDPPGNSGLPLSDRNMSALLTPRRSFIGGAVYVRMANGNKLVRDPKASSRALASEKVRWSLHKVRSRIVKKQQYCQFFTRFGKCKKANGKCPYIHDADKVVVCTKYLKSTCTNPNCLLTHKVIPERMPDCSFFVQGLCINEECPYRHVNVKPEAPICEAFLKGYCDAGYQCDKKHSYVCPEYAVSGECSDRKNCKLHHPKKKDHPGSNEEPKSEKRRYFIGVELPRSPLPVETTSGKTPMIDALTEFISLDGVTVNEIKPEDFRIVRKQPSRQLILSFDSLSQVEVDRLIKPEFIR